MAEGIVYAEEPHLATEDFIDVLKRSTLADRRPVGSPDRIARMIAAANVLVTARDGGRLIGVSRCLTDFVYCAYCSDLAVDQAYQGRGVGKALLARSHALCGPETSLILLSAPGAMTFYPRAGMRAAQNCFVFDRKS